MSQRSSVNKLGYTSKRINGIQIELKDAAHHVTERRPETLPTRQHGIGKQWPHLGNRILRLNAQVEIFDEICQWFGHWSDQNDTSKQKIKKA
jgi:hypothetical protein